MDNDACIACKTEWGNIVREISLTYSGHMKVHVQPGLQMKETDHTLVRANGGHGSVELLIGDRARVSDRAAFADYLPLLLTDIQFSQGCMFGQTVEVVKIDNNLRIGVNTRHGVQKYEGVSAFEWFDALVGSELAARRHHLTILASMQDNGESPNGRIMEIPAVTIDRMFDQVRQHHFALHR
jgi:hypothetical protein